MFSLSFDIQLLSQQINENGFTIFITAILLTLSLYHFLLFFQHKDKAFLYYSLYTFLVFLHSYYRAHFFFIADFMQPITPFILFHHASLKWLYASVYLLFAIHFIDLYKYDFSWNKWIRLGLKVSLYFLLFTFVTSWISGDQRWSEYSFDYFFFPLMLWLSILVLVLLFRTESKVKYYLIIGFGFFFLFSLTTQVLFFLGYDYRIIFYTGLIIEATLFALGLGAKQKQILLDKNAAQMDLIVKQKQNLVLQQKIAEELDKEIEKHTKELLEISRQKEIESKKRLALIYSKKALDLRLQALQTQMNPHFLFNSLNSIKHFIIKNKKEDATFFLSKLSGLLRKILDNSQVKQISLREELQIMRLYLDLENTRLNKEIRFDIFINPSVDIDACMLPPMVLQPFIENAIWHGLALVKGEKHIEIRVEKDDDYLMIRIRDNGIGREKAHLIGAQRVIKKQSLGIALTRQRLEAFTTALSRDVRIFFEDLIDADGQPEGTVVHIHIPIYNKTNNTY